MLPLHSSDQVDKAKEFDLEKFGIKKGSIISASSNMWKSFFGDGEDLMKGIGELIKNNPKYHHVFIGTPRCLDNLENYLINNPEIRGNIHFLGPVKNIYRVLKSIDFWINSFPVTGGTNIEMAKIGKPSIDISLNRNLDLHPAEFLSFNETNVISLEEFVSLGNKLIKNKDYRIKLGKYLKIQVDREFDKQRLVSERIYKEFIKEYIRRFNKSSRMPRFEIESTINYEKRIALYNAYGTKCWSYQKKDSWLKECIKKYPYKAFAWLKLLENVILNNELDKFEN